MSTKTPDPKKLPPWMIALIVVLAVVVVVAIIVLVIFTLPPSQFNPTFSVSSQSTSSTSGGSSSTSGSSSSTSSSSADSGNFVMNTSYTTIDTAAFWSFAFNSQGRIVLNVPNLQAFANFTTADFFTSRSLPAAIIPSANRTINTVIGTVAGVPSNSLRAVVGTNGTIVFSNGGSAFPASTNNVTNGPGAQQITYNP